jgi:hypothetical protein
VTRPGPPGDDTGAVGGDPHQLRTERGQTPTTSIEPISTFIDFLREPSRTTRSDVIVAGIIGNVEQRVGRPQSNDDNNPGDPVQA